MKMNLESGAALIAAVGAVNWGLLQFAKVDLVSYLGTYASIGYGLVAAAGVYVLYKMFA